MSYMIVLAGATALLSFGAIWLVSFAAPPPRWLRTSVLIGALTLMVVAPFTFYELLGRPKPVLIKSLPALTTVVSFVLDGQDRIHLTVQNKVWDTPRLISLVWDKELVKKLVEQRQRANKQGRELGMGVSTTDDPTDVFYVLTPPFSPAKNQVSK